MLRSRRPSEWSATAELPTSGSNPKLNGRNRSCRLRLDVLRIKNTYLKIVLVLSMALSMVYYILFRTTTQPELKQSIRTPVLQVNASFDLKFPATRPSLPAGKPPLVDRSILERLALLESSISGADEFLFFRQDARNTVAWPPMVTRIPEPPVIIQPGNTYDFDKDVCGSSPCLFLLPLRIGEQESKARIHFLQMVELAHSLGRTLVLPNVGKSRIGTCFHWDFETYYDLSSFASAGEPGPHLPLIISMSDFKNWTSMRPDQPTGQIILLNAKPVLPDSLSQNTTTISNYGAEFVVDDDLNTLNATLSRCIPNKLPRLSLLSHSPIFVHPSQADRDSLGRKSLGTFIMEGLSEIMGRNSALRQEYGNDILPDRERKNLQEPDVLVIDWDFRYPIFEDVATSQSAVLKYSPWLTTLAMKLSAPLGPYLAVHWRMETVPPEVLPHCAAALVNTLVSLLADRNAHDIRTVWFASDYPYPISTSYIPEENENREGSAKSGTFKAVVQEHEEAIDILRMAFGQGGALSAWKITGLAEELGRVRGEVNGNDGLLEDPGVLGILDKVVAMKSALFVSGAKGCGRVSSFTKQVIEARQDAWDIREDGPRNVVERFGVYS